MTERTRSDTVDTPTLNTTLDRVDWAGSDGNQNQIETQSPAFANRDYFKTTTTRTMTDNVTPNFLKRIAAGEIINSPMDSNIVVETHPVPTSYHSQRYDIDQYGNKVGYSQYGTWVIRSEQLGTYLDPHGAGWDDELDTKIAQAVTQAHANASLAELQLPVVAAEAEKSVRSMTSIMGRLFKIVKAAKRLDVQYLKRQITKKELEDRWMELRYALRPLVYDAQGAMAAAVSTELHTHTRRTSRGFQAFSVSDSDSVYLPDNGDPRTIVRTAQCDVNIRAGVLSDVIVTGMNAWGMDQIVDSIWELIPFSFIVDWIINVGDTIASWTPNAGVRELASWVTIEHVTTQTNRMTSLNFSNPGAFANETYNWSGQFKSAKTVHKWRVVNPSLSILPSVKVNFSAAKLLDLVIIGKKRVSADLRI